MVEISEDDLSSEFEMFDIDISKVGPEIVDKSK